MREFTTIKGKRFVKAAVTRLLVYHPECAPENTVGFEFIRTEKTICAKCYDAIYKEIK